MCIVRMPTGMQANKYTPVCFVRNLRISRVDHNCRVMELLAADHQFASDTYFHDGIPVNAPTYAPFLLLRRQL